MNSTSIPTTNPNNLVYVSDFHKNVWLSIQHQSGSSHVTLNREQAQMLIDQLAELISEEEGGDDEPPEQDPEPAYRARGDYSLEELKGIL
jgi:hypothetical protein